MFLKYKLEAKLTQHLKQNYKLFCWNYLYQWYHTIFQIAKPCALCSSFIHIYEKLWVCNNCDVFPRLQLTYFALHIFTAELQTITSYVILLPTDVRVVAVVNALDGNVVKLIYVEIYTQKQHTQYFYVNTMVVCSWKLSHHL